MKVQSQEYQPLKGTHETTDPADNSTENNSVDTPEIVSPDKPVNYPEILKRLNQFDLERELHATNKSELSKLYASVINTLTEAGYTDLIEQVKGNFAPSNKWPKLILHTSFILGSPGALGVIISMFCALGHAAVCATPLALTIYIPAFLLAVPYYIKKSKGDVSKEELVERINGLILAGKGQTLGLIKNEPNLLNNINKKISTSILPPERDFFNSSALHTFYMFTGVISLIGGGLLLFSLVSPAAIAITCVAAVVFSIFYYKTNSTFINGFNQKKYSNTLLRQEITARENKSVLFQSTDKISSSKRPSPSPLQVVSIGK